MQQTRNLRTPSPAGRVPTNTTGRPPGCLIRMRKTAGNQRQFLRPWTSVPKKNPWNLCDNFTSHPLLPFPERQSTNGLCFDMLEGAIWPSPVPQNGVGPSSHQGDLALLPRC